DIPKGAAAGFPCVVVVCPGLVPRLTGPRDRVEPPQQLASFGVDRRPVALPPALAGIGMKWARCREQEVPADLCHPRLQPFRRQIPIVAKRSSLSRGFVHRRLSDAGPYTGSIARPGPASETLPDSGRSNVPNRPSGFDPKETWEPVGSD